MSDSFKNYLLLLLLGFIWGSSFIMMKRGLEVFSPMQIAALRMFLACIVLLPFFIKLYNQIPAGKMKFIALSGLVGSGIPAFLFPLAQTNLDSAITGVLNSLTPVFTLMIGYFAFNIRVLMSNTLGIILGFSGAFLLVMAADNGSLEGRFFFAFLVVIAAFCYALNTNLLKAFLNGVPPLHIASGNFMFLGLPSAVYLLFSDFQTSMLTHDYAWQAFFYIALLAIVGTAFALIIFNRILQNTQAVFASTVTYLIPVVAVFWGVVDGESFSLLQFGGMCLILSGIYLTRSNKKKSPNSNISGQD